MGINGAPTDNQRPSINLPGGTDLTDATRRQQFVLSRCRPTTIWTLTSNGRTDQAFASLWPSRRRIKANRGMGINRR